MGYTDKTREGFVMLEKVQGLFAEVKIEDAVRDGEMQLFGKDAKDGGVLTTVAGCYDCDSTEGAEPTIGFLIIERKGRNWFTDEHYKVFPELRSVAGDVVDKLVISFVNGVGSTDGAYLVKIRAEREVVPEPRADGMVEVVLDGPGPVWDYMLAAERVPTEAPEIVKIIEDAMEAIKSVVGVKVPVQSYKHFRGDGRG